VRIGASSTDIRLEQTITLTGKQQTFARREVFFSDEK
jgi:hypothetical protein